MSNYLTEAIEKIQGQRILVIGDMIADIYLNCSIARISREAPVLVLEQQEEKIVAGGAANVVNNAATLGGKVYAAGLLGNDSGADGLLKILGDRGVNTEAMLKDSQRATLSKTRVIAGGRTTVSQQVVRIDKECKEPMPEGLELELSEKLTKILPEIDGVVLSDYGTGTITDKLKEQILDYCHSNSIPSIVDSRYNVKGFKGVGYVKQNDAEVSAAVGFELNTREDIERAGKQLLKEMDAKGILVTLGGDGMMLFESNGAIHTIPVTDKSEVFDVSGAGDTCVATVILALSAGVEPKIAAELSNFASGIAVRKMGTAVVFADELRSIVEEI